MKYERPGDGEWVEPIRKGACYKLACCDCGLVHSLEFRIIGKVRQIVQFRMFRDYRATAAMRRKRSSKKTLDMQHSRA